MNYDNARPVPKKGLLRMFELIDRDGTKFLKAGALAFAGLLPFMAAVTAAVASASPVFLLGCIPAGMLAAPELCAAADTVMRSMREEVGWWWWDTYKTVWRRELKASLLPGALLGLIAGLEIFSLYMLTLLTEPAAEFWMLAASAWAGLGILGYYLPMMVTMELPFPTLLRNCFALFFMHPVKSLLASLVRLVYYGLILVWFPLTSVVFLLLSVWFPMLASCMILYPVLDKHLALESNYEKLRAAQWGGTEETGTDGIEE